MITSFVFTRPAVGLIPAVRVEYRTDLNTFTNSNNFTIVEIKGLDVFEVRELGFPSQQLTASKKQFIDFAVSIGANLQMISSNGTQTLV